MWGCRSPSYSLSVHLYVLSKPDGWWWMMVGHHASSLVTVPVMAGGQDMVIFTEAHRFILWHLPCKYQLINAFLPIPTSRKYQNLFVFTWQEQHWSNALWERGDGKKAEKYISCPSKIPRWSNSKNAFLEISYITKQLVKSLLKVWPAQ